MRLKHMFVALAAVLMCGFSVAQPAKADGWNSRGYKSVAYKKVYPRKKHHYRARPVFAAYVIDDPYAYRYEPRGYYPYYDAGYWRPQCASRSSCVPREFQPPYWKAWGYPKPWYNREFHAIYHGRIRPWHW